MSGLERRLTRSLEHAEARAIMQYMHSDITGAIIEAFYDVYNALGSGFLEKVYENALAHELRKRGHTVSQQAAISVMYDGVVAGEYYADLVIDDAVVVELKAVEGLAREHESQLVNYLKASCFEVGLLLNFGPRAEVRRKIFQTARIAKASAPPSPALVKHGRTVTDKDP